MARAGDIEGLDCGAGAGAGLRLVLVSRLDETLGYRDAALDAKDAEGVHDMRVASRRLRCALRDFMPYLDEKKLAGVGGGLKQLADALGGVRDLDVELAALEEAAQGAPEEARAGVEELARERRDVCAAAREELAGELREERLASLRAEFAGALARAPGKARKPGKTKGSVNAHRDSFAVVGREIVLARWEEMRERGASLYRPFKTKRLHKARISAKRLRYALELFAPCLGEELKDIAKEVARLQKSLGELHDCDERIAALGRELSRRGSGVDGAETDDDDDASARGRVEASAWLFDYFVERRDRHFRAAFARWGVWESEGFESRLRECVGAPGSEGRPAPVEADGAAAD